jgi:acyl carrier protein
MKRTYGYSFVMIDLEPLRAFLRTHFRLSPRRPLTEEEDLPSMILDTVSWIELADFIEETYEIQLSQEDLVAYRDNFRSLRSITAFVDRKRREGDSDRSASDRSTEERR